MIHGEFEICNCRLLKWVVYISFDMSFDSSAIFSDALDINGLYAPRKSKLTVPSWKHRTSQNPLYSHHADRPASNVFKLLGGCGVAFPHARERVFLIVSITESIPYPR